MIWLRKIPTLEEQFLSLHRHSGFYNGFLEPHTEEHEFYAFKFWQDVVCGHPPEAFGKTNGHSGSSVINRLPFKARNKRQIQKVS